MLPSPQICAILDWVTAQRTPTGPILIGSQVALLALLVASGGYILLDIATKLLLGCPPGDGQSEGPPAELSLIPPGATCTYRLSTNDGLLTVDPSWFPTVVVLMCVVGLVAISRVKKLSDPWNRQVDASTAAAPQSRSSH